MNRQTLIRNRHKQKNEDQYLNVPHEASRFQRVTAFVSSTALLHNYQTIADQAKNSFLLPMIKANAYGHGDVWVAHELLSQPKLYGLGVATLDEAFRLRQNLGLKARKVKIVVVSGTAHWTKDKADFCERYQLTPVIATSEDWVQFIKNRDYERLSYHIKFNTGMNRLGVLFSDVQKIRSQIQKLGHRYMPEGIATHFACAENPSHALTRLQVKRFLSIKQELQSACPQAFFHCANSAAIWNAKKLGIEVCSDIVRPGLSLYGARPWVGAPQRGLQPVLSLHSPVIAKHQLKKGDSIGYGATFTVQSSQQWVAICSIGYGDGVHRLLSNRGHVFLGGKLRRVLGIISMDLAAVECDASTKLGDSVEWIGNSIDPWTQALAAGTIPYEIYTSLSQRVFYESEQSRS